jgi:hypothetical protein
MLYLLLYKYCFFIFVFGVNSKNLFLPWSYGGDGLGTYQAVQKEFGMGYDMRTLGFALQAIGLYKYESEN